MKLRKTWLLLAVLAPFSLFDSTSAEDKVEKGFALLFNGKDLSGFKPMIFAEPGEKHKAFNTFTAKNGVLHVSGKPAGYLYTEKIYKNYVLRYDWKCPKSGNSGCFVHIVEPGSDRAHWIEVNCFGQIEGGSTDRIALKRAAIKVGEWNTTEVVSKDGELTSTVNGVVVSTKEGLGNAQGSIGFQSEGSDWWYKNIRIRVTK